MNYSGGEMLRNGAISCEDLDRFYTAKSFSGKKINVNGTKIKMSYDTRTHDNKDFCVVCFMKVYKWNLHIKTQQHIKNEQLN